MENETRPIFATMQAGEHFNHKSLGEVRVDKVWPNGDLTVTSVNVIGGDNVFRLTPPVYPSHWLVSAKGPKALR